MKADSQTERDVLGVLDRVGQLYGQNQTDEARKLFVDQDDITVINTGIDEEAIGWDQIRAGAERDYAQTQGDVPINWKRRWVSVQGDVAWASGESSADININGHQMTVDSRFTAVLLRDGGSWKVHTMHFSLPHPEQKPGESWPKGGTAEDIRAARS